MFSRKVSQPQLCAWLLVAMSAPLAQIAGGSVWTEALLIGAVCLCACWFVCRMGYDQMRWGIWLCVIECIWIVVILGTLARWVEGSWPVGNTYPAVPIILLILAAASADAGGEKASRVGSVLFWLLALVYSAVLYAGVGEIQLKSIDATPNLKDAGLILVFLIPALAIFLPRGQKGIPLKVLIGILGFAVVISVWVTGGISSRVAGSVKYPLYEWVRGLSLFGTAQRFEAVVSVALTMGWFALFSFMLSIAGHLAENIRPGWGRAAVWVCAGAVAGSTLLNDWVPTGFAAAGSAIVWVLLPIIYTTLNKRKNHKKFKDFA